jgi:TPR repeat protein
MTYFKKSVENGCTSANSNIVWMYHKGLGVPPDYVKAVILYQKAMEEKDTELHGFAINGLGLLYQEGSGPSQSNKNAMEHLTRAAELYNGDAYNSIGEAYKNGNTGDNKKDYNEAIIWFTKFANKGSHDGQLNIGIMYYEGLRTNVDYAIAHYWLEKASKNGVDEAQFYLNQIIHKTTFNEVDEWL